MNQQVLENTKSCCSVPSSPAAESIAPRKKEHDLRPLFVIVGYLIAATIFKAILTSDLSRESLMRDSMGFFFIIFSMFKFFNLQGFAEAFSSYDLLAKRFRLYAVAYPFLELILGGLYLSGRGLLFANLLTLGIMSIGTLGVYRALRSDHQFQCACLGSVLKLPMTVVTLVENIAMGAMALLMLSL